jgi:hypothetical protein
VVRASSPKKYSPTWPNVPDFLSRDFPGLKIATYQLSGAGSRLRFLFEAGAIEPAAGGGRASGLVGWGEHDQAV